MAIESHCTSLELSKRLKEAGVEQKSCFYWNAPVPETFKTEQEKMALKNIEPEIYQAGLSWGKHFENYSAFLASELGEILPPGVWSGKSKEGWYDCWHQTSKLPDDLEFHAKTQADCLGEMLLHLLTNKLI